VSSLLNFQAKYVSLFFLHLPTNRKKTTKTQIKTKLGLGRDKKGLIKYKLHK
jgi:hypothetical protein